MRTYIIYFLIVFFSSCENKKTIKEIKDGDESFYLELPNKITNKQLGEFINGYLEIINSISDSNRIVQLFLKGGEDTITWTISAISHKRDFFKRVPRGLIIFKKEVIFLYTPLDNFYLDSNINYKIEKLAIRKLIADDAKITDYPTWSITFKKNVIEARINKRARHPFAQPLRYIDYIPRD